MKYTTKFISLLLLVFCLLGTKSMAQNTVKNEALHQLFENYYQERLKLFPLEATSSGDERYNNLLPNDGSQAFLKETHDLNTKYQKSLNNFKPDQLNAEDKISYYILKDVLARELEAEQFHRERMPFAQFFALPLTMGQLGNGKGNQPFKTVKDYENWLERIDAFTVYADTTIANFRKGIKSGMVLPKALVVKMVPQYTSLAEKDPAKNVFYGPINNFPVTFTTEEKARLTKAYTEAINTKLIPAYQRMCDFFAGEYMNAARSTSGISALPNGDAFYRYNIYFFTTQRTKPEDVHQTGLKEVKRITGEMERLKDKIGFKGTLKELFNFMQTDKQFMPFKTNKEVLDANGAVLEKVKPYLSKYFSMEPKTPFEMREVEAFRAAAAAPQYNRSSADGKRPGIYYFPIVDPTKVNVTNFALEATFIHEAIPGHHYQISLMQENKSLPSFRRFANFPVFSEGWALYVESLGDILGCYTDPYQKMGAYGMEIHRAIRLVVDTGLHTGMMTREDAIKYMMDNEAIAEKTATAEIERYMAMPGQALAYKTGELKIKELRDKYQKQLGNKFSLRNFHDALLQGGSMPLNVLEMYMAEWVKTQ
ncbi:DUF885 domain-containing protein [Flavobacterium sangjuense]|uniref:DUF885 domain-containing protein n=1 Tax=Flavobacterium sangjuense TaxID=2518177 RepID=A0A4P7PV16_9FLAO|nr:DUF885 domain-containing protein [Flavobacterium sangjuense]QBZ98545.1 hypothetical protein GS03_02053 [Flavobacterium sangjuense]